LYAPVPIENERARLQWCLRGRTSGSSANELGRAVQRDGFEARGVIRAHGAEDDEQEGLVRRTYADGFLGPNCARMRVASRATIRALTERRAHVQAVTWLLRDPVLVKADELLDEIQQRVAVERLAAWSEK
jgi:hypothetical protein